MGRYLRWQGFVGFFAIVALIVGLLYVFAEPLIKKGIEKGTSLYTGAEVNVADVELTYSPVSLTVKDFQATDPEKPTHNMISFAKAQAGLDLWQYLFGKVIIDELAVEGVAFAVERASEGDVYITTEESADDASPEKGLSLDEIKDDLPSAKDVINNSDLITIKAGKNLQTSYRNELAKLKDVKESLPSKDALKQYQAEVKALAELDIKTPQDLAQLKEKYDALKEKLTAEKNKLKQAKEQISNSKEIISHDVIALKNAPQQDWQAIEQKYQLDSFEGGDLAHILFGEQAREYYDIAETVYQRIAPMLAAKETTEQEEEVAASGRFVLFDEEQALPELLVKKAHFSITSPQGDFVIEFDEFTHQHWIRQMPTLYRLNSNNLKGKGEVLLNGEFNVNENSDFASQGKWSLMNLLLENMPLSASDKLSLLMTSADLFASGNFSLNNAHVDAANSFTIKNAQYQNNSDTKLSNIVMESLASKDKLVVDLGIFGHVEQPSLSVSSPLDDLFKDALNKQIDTKVAEFKSKVQQGLQDKLTEQLNLSSDEAGELANLDALLSDSDEIFDNLLKSNVVKQQEDKLKNKAKDKLKDKLKGKLGDLF